eukprot:scaffold14974_cov195-Amphora_coffeaeformis.AAC.50
MSTTKILIRHIKNDALEESTAPSPVSGATVVPDLSSHNNNEVDKLTPQTSSSHHHLWTTKRLSVSWTSLPERGSFRLNVLPTFFATTTSKRLEAEIQAAQQSMGIALFSYIQTQYYEPDPVLFLESLFDNNNSNNKLSLLATLRPLWLEAYKDVSALKGKRDALSRESTAITEQLQQALLLSAVLLEKNKNQVHQAATANNKLKQWKLTFRQTLLQGQMQDLDSRMEHRKDTFGVDLYHALQQKLSSPPHEEQNRLLAHEDDDDKVIFDAFEQCRETIRGIVLHHQQNQQDAMSKVMNYHGDHLPSTTTSCKSNDPDAVTRTVPHVVTPTKEKDGEESVTEVTETDDDEYDDVEVMSA